jgi:uncharacterized protein YtpQ (UPF0354 family)
MEEKLEHHHGDFENIEAYSIPETEAVERTAEWRKFIRRSVPGELDEDMVPRAVFISMADIAALYEKHKDDAIGVRAYFTKTVQPDYYHHKHHHKHHRRKPEISVVIVPVSFDDKDMISSELMMPAGASNVYDFTKPCPDLCDVSSPLYS